MKRVLVDQGNRAEIMYPDLYKGLNLKPEDLTSYDSPLVGFDGNVVIPKGHIRLLVQAGLEVVELDFIVVDAYSSYIAIVVALAPCPRCCFFHPSFESEVFVRIRSRS